MRLPTPPDRRMTPTSWFEALAMETVCFTCLALLRPGTPLLTCRDNPNQTAAHPTKAAVLGMPRVCENFCGIDAQIQAGPDAGAARVVEVGFKVVGAAVKLKAMSAALSSMKYKANANTKR
mmetsp:Transcript_91137/g.162244  ORF Transcript_91137/g.162244 Transcript_91137/m.162244 type:complete len:121 (-) Transcript_91137:82-444(-)